jgi:hypothetical protein
MQAEEHNMLPNIVGPYLPRNDVEISYKFYCASMLSLLRPWREIQDLLVLGQSWSISFASFIHLASTHNLDFISATQYYYACKDTAACDQEHAPSVECQHSIPQGGIDADRDSEDEEPDEHSLSFIIQPPCTEAELKW